MIFHFLLFILYTFLKILFVFNTFFSVIFVLKIKINEIYSYSEKSKISFTNSNKFILYEKCKKSKMK